MSGCCGPLPGSHRWAAFAPSRSARTAARPSGTPPSTPTSTPDAASSASNPKTTATSRGAASLAEPAGPSPPALSRTAGEGARSDPVAPARGVSPRREESRAPAALRPSHTAGERVSVRGSGSPHLHAAAEATRTPRTLTPRPLPHCGSGSRIRPSRCGYEATAASSRPGWSLGAGLGVAVGGSGLLEKTKHSEPSPTEMAMKMKAGV